MFAKMHSDTMLKLKKWGYLAFWAAVLPLLPMSAFIGRESGYQPFEEYSLVSAPYKVDNGPVGVLAVVGPTRMDYEKVIPTVDITARILSAALTQL